ncbi:MAG: Asp-tRNA(Asn)/Glu-tRNA(Gln) amidotransferase subunit GatC [Deltaproteobacteria bacterium]|nr:Asp-tRNA(Asn)/Glu-tRNA(Gln) amidotransferase subunit GatC [Deltaproteobacteria bacterium]
MALGPAEVRRLLRLAHLELPRVADGQGGFTEPERSLVTEAELTRLAQELEQILAHVEELKLVDTTGVEATSHGVALPTAWRADVAGPALEEERALGGAPARVGQAFSVPKIVE